MKAIDPLAKAASGRPEGARVTVKVSTTSAYISFDVCRTLDRRQGNAGVLAGTSEGVLELDKLVARFPD